MMNYLLVFPEILPYSKVNKPTILMTRNSVPLFLSTANTLRALIRCHVLKYVSRVPSAEVMAADEVFEILNQLELLVCD